MKPTPAQLAFLRQHTDQNWQHKNGGYADGYRPRRLADHGSPTYDFVGRAARAGLIEIVNADGVMRWPYSWKGTQITDAGRAAIGEKP